MTTITPAALANGGALDNALDAYYTTGGFGELDELGGRAAPGARPLRLELHRSGRRHRESGARSRRVRHRRCAHDVHRRTDVDRHGERRQLAQRCDRRGELHQVDRRVGFAERQDPRARRRPDQRPTVVPRQLPRHQRRRPRPGPAGHHRHDRQVPDARPADVRLQRSEPGAEGSRHFVVQQRGDDHEAGAGPGHRPVQRRRRLGDGGQPHVRPGRPELRVGLARARRRRTTAARATPPRPPASPTRSATWSSSGPRRASRRRRRSPSRRTRRRRRTRATRSTRSRAPTAARPSPSRRSAASSPSPCRTRRR